MKSLITTVIAIFVASVVILWMLTYLHNSRVNEGFSQVNKEQKTIAFMSSLKQAESFADGSAQPLAPPASLQQQRKTNVYLNNGLVTFIGSDKSAGIEFVNKNYLIFFQPTQSDLQCDFTNINTPSSCISPLDTISANDAALSIPSSIQSSQPYAVSAPNADLNTRLYVLGSVYNLSRVSVNSHCWAAPYRVPSRSGAPRVLLALPRADYVTRLIFLLRPTYIRASSSGVADSMLYWVEWDFSGLDGVTYQSQFQAPPSVSATGVYNAVLSLVQVTGFDQNGMVDPVTTPPLPSIDVVINRGSNIQPIGSDAPARVLNISSGSTTSLVLYYPKYSMTSPMGLSATGASRGQSMNQQQVGTVYASVVTGSYASLADRNGNIIISVSVPGGPKSVATVSVPAGGGTTFSVPFPTGSPAYVVASAVHDIVTLAVFTPLGTVVSSMQLVKSLNYYPGAAGTVTYGGGAKGLSVGRYNSTSIPNFADIALTLGSLPLSPSSPSSGISVEKFEGGEMARASHRTSLTQGESLLPGESIVSPSGAYVAIYQLDGQLAVYETATNVMKWSSGLVTKDPFYTKQVVYGNNGTVSCSMYCGGVDGSSWNNELPANWNGASCLSSDNPSAKCDKTAGSPIQCTCVPNGNGWNKTPASSPPASTEPIPIIAGKCTLGKDGVLKLIAGGVNQSLPSSTPYWTSTSSSPPGADQSPFALMVVDDPPGRLHIVGKFSATPVWASEDADAIQSRKIYSSNSRRIRLTCINGNYREYSQLSKDSSDRLLRAFLVGEGQTPGILANMGYPRVSLDVFTAHPISQLKDFMIVFDLTFPASLSSYASSATAKLVSFLNDFQIPNKGGGPYLQNVNRAFTENWGIKALSAEWVTVDNPTV